MFKVLCIVNMSNESLYSDTLHATQLRGWGWWAGSPLQSLTAAGGGLTVPVRGGK